MSSYHSSFTYLNKNSKNDLGWLIVNFEPDNGETDSYLSQEQIYAESYRRSKRLLYGTRYENVSTIKMIVIKCDGKDFTLEECRSAYRWLIGNPRADWLDLYAGDALQYSFLGTIKDVKPYKLDARTIALVIYFESTSPWGYSPIQNFSCDFDQILSLNNDTLDSESDIVLLNIDSNGVLYNAANSGVLLEISAHGVTSADNPTVLQIYNRTDDLYEYVYPNIVIVNNNSDYLSIKNITLGEETILTGMSINEKITLSSGQFIISDIMDKVFGNSFNFVWPRLAPGLNEIVIEGSGSGHIDLAYRHPIKIGDCAIDTNIYNDDVNCDCPDSDSGSDCGCTINEQDLQEMLARILS